MNIKHKFKKPITITEYWCIWTIEKDINNTSYQKVSEETFSELESFVLNEKNQAQDIFKLQTKSWYWKVISAQNYVWVIETKNWTLIEILPKISEEENIWEIRNIFLRMLKTLKNSPFKNLNEANLKNQKFPILEIFIELFLSELFILVKKWIKKNYVSEVDNLNFIKWKLKIKENISKNVVDHSRFFCEHDEFSDDTKENRLIKTCLLKLSKISLDKKNQQNINLFLHLFSDVWVCKNINIDLKLIDNLNRLHTYYLPTLKWVKLFLWNESVVNFSWNTLALALLFPMEAVFESYVASVLRKRLKWYSVSIQDSWKYLVEDHWWKWKFRLRPDLVITNNSNNHLIIADTKRKKIDSSMSWKNYQIDQHDMYQLYAYAKKYQCDELYLIYPYTSSFLSDENISPFVYELKKDFDWNESIPIKLKAIPYRIDVNSFKNDKCILFDLA